jgi:hypothetical protein
MQLKKKKKKKKKKKSVNDGNFEIHFIVEILKFIRLRIDQFISCLVVDLLQRFFFLFSDFNETSGFGHFLKKISFFFLVFIFRKE